MRIRCEIIFFENNARGRGVKNWPGRYLRRGEQSILKSVLKMKKREAVTNENTICKIVGKQMRKIVADSWYETREETVRSFGSQIKSDFGEGNVKQTPSFPFYSQINQDVISNKFPWISVTRFYSDGERKERKAEIRLLKIKMILLLFSNFFPMLPAASNRICNES